MAPTATRKRLTAEAKRSISRALGDPRRFEILERVARGKQPSACTELRECFPIAAATLSHHLKELESAGLIETMRRGKFVDVYFCRDTWERYLATLGQL